MTIRDFRDSKNAIVTMFRGEDKSFDFLLPTGFIWSAHEVTAEGRLSTISTSADYEFDVTYSVDDDGIKWGTITFPSTLITKDCRDSKIYWKVFALNVAGDTNSVLQYGEIWIN